MNLKLIEYIKDNSPADMSDLKNRFENIHARLMDLVEKDLIFVCPVEGELRVWFQSSNKSGDKDE